MSAVWKPTFQPLDVNAALKVTGLHGLDIDGCLLCLLEGNVQLPRLHVDIGLERESSYGGVYGADEG